jgi:hypothetical protein
MKQKTLIKASYTAKEWVEIINSCVTIQDTKYEKALKDSEAIVQKFHEIENAKPR